MHHRKSLRAERFSQAASYATLQLTVNRKGNAMKGPVIIEPPI
jgi:hypothetical protein